MVEVDESIQDEFNENIFTLNEMIETENKLNSDVNVQSVLVNENVENVEITYKSKKMKVRPETKKKAEMITFLYVNARSANNKLDEIRSMAQDVFNAKVICITETWFNKSSKVKMDNFNLVAFQHRRSNKVQDSGIGGGVAIYVHQSIAHDCFEIKLKTKSGLTQNAAASICGQVVVVTYRSPSTANMNKSRRTKILQTIANDWRTMKMGSQNPLWMGDFNFPMISFQDNLCHDREYDEVFEAITGHGLDQLIDESTHSGGNQLDLLFSGPESKLASFRVEPQLDDFDHRPITGKILVDVPEVDLDLSKDIFVYSQGDYDKFRQLIKNADMDWHLKNPDVDRAVEGVVDTIIEAFKECVPTRKVYLKKDRETNYGKDTIAAIEKAKKLKTQNKKAYRFAQGKANKLIRRDNLNAKKKLLRKMNQRKDVLYKVVTDADRDCETEVIGPLFKGDSEELTTSTEEVLAEMRRFLSSVFAPKEKPNIDWDDYDANEKPVFENVTFTKEKVLRSINAIPLKCAIGPDLVAPKMLKEARHELAPILARLFQRIIDKGKCPKMWKLSRVRLLKKPGERTAATNHRPIAVGSVLEKVFSRIVVWELVPFLMCNDLISDRQYGFLPGKRLVENIIRFEDSVADLLDNGDPVTSVYLDIRKCFDTVPHKELFETMFETGIVGKVGKYWENYYDNYEQYIEIDTEKSENYQVSSGVIQGSVAGPIHFLVFYNSLLSICKNVHLAGFADDIKLWSVTRNQDDVDAFNDDLKRVENEMKKKKLQFNVKKSIVLYLGNRNPKLDIILEGEVLKSEDAVRDLGVFYSRHRHKILSKKDHISKVLSSINSKTGIIRRHFRNVDFKTYCFMYKCYILPHFLFAAEFFLNEKDEVSLKELNKTYEKYFHDVKIPEVTGDVLKFFPENPVRKALISNEKFFWLLASGYLSLSENTKLEFKEASDHETRQANANKNQLKIKTARLNPLYSSFTQSHSVLWNLYSDEDLKSCDNYCVAAEKRIDRDLPFLKSSYDAILNGKFVDQTQRRRAHIRRNLGRR